MVKWMERKRETTVKIKKEGERKRKQKVTSERANKIKESEN